MGLPEIPEVAVSHARMTIKQCEGLFSLLVHPGAWMTSPLPMPSFGRILPREDPHHVHNDAPTTTTRNSFLSSFNQQRQHLLCQHHAESTRAQSSFSPFSYQFLVYEKRQHRQTRSAVAAPWQSPLSKTSPRERLSPPPPPSPPKHTMLTRTKSPTTSSWSP